MLTAEQPGLHRVVPFQPYSMNNSFDGEGLKKCKVASFTS